LGGDGRAATYNKTREWLRHLLNIHYGGSHITYNGGTTLGFYNEIHLAMYLFFVFGF
jgi:hypothetical protein